MQELENLRALERLVQTEEMAGLSSVVRSTVLPGRLKLGRDVLGSGTPDDPYWFRPSLDYYEAFPRFCEQEGFRIDRRVAWISGGLLGDQVTTPEREIFFRKGEL